MRHPLRSTCPTTRTIRIHTDRPPFADTPSKFSHATLLPGAFINGLGEWTLSRVSRTGDVTALDASIFALPGGTVIGGGDNFLIPPGHSLDLVIRSTAPEWAFTLEVFGVGLRVEEIRNDKGSVK